MNLNTVTWENAPFSAKKCTSDSCSNGGICQERNGTAHCTCSTGFTGPSCTLGRRSINIYKQQQQQ